MLRILQAHHIDRPDGDVVDDELENIDRCHRNEALDDEKAGAKDRVTGCCTPDKGQGFVEAKSVSNGQRLLRCRISHRADSGKTVRCGYRRVDLGFLGTSQPDKSLEVCSANKNATVVLHPSMGHDPRVRSPSNAEADSNWYATPVQQNAQGQCLGETMFATGYDSTDPRNRQSDVLGSRDGGRESWGTLACAP